MKTKLLLSVLLSFIFCLLSSQIPQGFNYQAIVRNTTGEVLQNKSLKVTVAIKTALSGGAVLWEEYHNVTSNQFGMVSFAVGSGNYVSGTVSSFSFIDWKAQLLYLKTTVEYPVGTVTDMGTAQILSVPYSLVAKDVEGPIKKLDIKGTEASLDSALFEVKNRNGQTIFAVYNEGVRVYVDNGAKGAKGGFAVGGFDMAKGTKQTFLAISDDSVKIYIDSNPATKKPKGGFAVGGYDMAKGTVQNYIDVSADSIRMYIDKNTKAKKGGFAVGSFDMSKGGTDHFFDVATDASGIINPPQNRILWYPLKNAFLTGKILVEKPDSIGENSFSSGYESKAIGLYSQALGYKAIARGDYSTAIGKNAVANEINSFAFGDGAKIMKGDSYAFGAGAIAKGIGSYALGSAGRDTLGVLTGNMTTASGDYSFAIGQGSRSTGLLAIALGTNVIASGTSSTAMGYLTTASGDESTAMGMNNWAIGQFSTAMGYLNAAQGQSSFVTGFSNEASGDFSTAMGALTKASGGMSFSVGFGTRASGDWSIAMGRNPKASGENSLAFGSSTIASGKIATSMGESTIASGNSSTALGSRTIASGSYSTAMGYYTKVRPCASFVVGQYNDTTWSSIGKTTWLASDPVIIAGNGTADNARSNAFTVYKNGMTAIGHSTPTQMLDVNGNARFRSIASGTYGFNLNITSDGTLTTSTSDISMKKDIIPISDALSKVLEMNGVYFSWKNDNLNGRRLGFIAQDMEKVLPEVVFTNPVDGLKGINYFEITAVLAQAVKEQQHQIESQQKEIDKIKALLNSLISNQTSQVNK